MLPSFKGLIYYFVKLTLTGFERAQLYPVLAALEKRRRRRKGLDDKMRVGGGKIPILGDEVVKVLASFFPYL